MSEQSFVRQTQNNQYHVFMCRNSNKMISDSYGRAQRFPDCNQWQIELFREHTFVFTRVVCEKVKMHSNYICDRSIYVLLPAGPACDGKDHEGMLVRQRWGSPHCAAREEVAIPAESTRGHQDIEQQIIIFTLPIHSLPSSRGVSEGATSSVEAYDNQGF